MSYLFWEHDIQDRWKTQKIISGTTFILHENALKIAQLLALRWMLANNCNFIIKKNQIT